MRREQRQQGMENPNSRSIFIHHMLINFNYECIIETCWDFDQWKLKKENPNPRSVFRFCTRHHIVPSQGFRDICRRVLNTPSSTCCHKFKQSVVATKGTPTAYCSGCFPLNYLINNQVLFSFSNNDDQLMKLILVSVISLYFQVRLFKTEMKKKKSC